MQTPVADWPSTGLNLCNSLAVLAACGSYALYSGPLFGALASVKQRSFDFCAALSPGSCTLAELDPGPQWITIRWRGGPPPRIPSLEERLDDH